MGPTDKRALRGFTLLELLISLALSTLLLGMLSAGMYSVVDDWQRESAFLDEAVDRSLVLLQLERALFAAFPHSYVSREQVQRFVYGHGDPESLRFVSSISLQATQELTAWSLENDERGLLLRLAPAYSDNPDLRLDDATPTLLLPGFVARYRYLVQRNPEEKQWLDEWPAETMQSLPMAVEIVLQPLPGSGEDDELLVMAPLPAYRHEDIEPTIPVL